MKDRYFIAETTVKQIIAELNYLKAQTEFKKERDTLLNHLIQDLQRAA
ncbi:MAG: hypothetical protein ACPG7F_06475 [Aggregatilineales bacterium]